MDTAHEHLHTCVIPRCFDCAPDQVYSLPGRKDDKQLHRLALANAEAEGVAEPEPGTTPGGKGSKPAPAAAAGKKPAAATTAAAVADTPARPFKPLTWALPAGSFDLASLGWVHEEGSGLPEIKPSTPSTPTVAKPGSASKGTRGTPGAKPGSAKPGAKPGSGKADPAQGVESTLTVRGLDTPCHRAGIRAYRASLQQVRGQTQAWMSFYVLHHEVCRCVKVYMATLHHQTPISGAWCML